jgi:hypothetical protein
MSQYTDLFQKYGSNNNNNFYYDPMTIGLNFEKQGDIMNNNEYIDMLKINNITCHGQWCVNDTYLCIDNNECYIPSHILSPYRENISRCYLINANRVVIYNEWKIQLRELSIRNYSAALEEKFLVFGQSLMINVSIIINNCISEIISNSTTFSSSNGSYHNTSNIPNNNEFGMARKRKVLLIMLLSFLAIISFLVFVVPAMAKLYM